MERKKISELFDFLPKSKFKASEGQDAGEYAFYTCSNILSKYIDVANFEPNKLIFGTGGSPGLHYATEPFSTSTDCIVLSPKISFVCKYIYYFLRQNWHILEQGFKGAGLKHISKEYISNIEILLPSLLEQEKIVARLDKANEIRDKKIKANEKLDELIKSQFVHMFGDPVKNDKNLPLVKFSDMGTLARGKSKHRPRNAPELLGGDYPLIQTGDVANAGLFLKNYNQTYSELGLKQSKMWEKGTLCITIAANIAKTSILTFDACFPDSVVGFIPNEKINIQYVQLWLMFLQEILESQAPQSAQKNINLEILNSLYLPYPNISEQNQFAKFVEKIEEQKSKNEVVIQKMTDLINSIMQKEFSS